MLLLLLGALLLLPVLVLLLLFLGALLLLPVLVLLLFLGALLLLLVLLLLPLFLGTPLLFGLGLLFRLSRFFRLGLLFFLLLLLFTLLLLRFVGKSRGSKKHRQNCCADNSNSFHCLLPPGILMFPSACAVLLAGVADHGQIRDRQMTALGGVFIHAVLFHLFLCVFLHYRALWHLTLRL